MNIDKSSLEQLLAKYFDKPFVADHVFMGEGKENISVRITLAGDKIYILRLWGDTHSYMGVRQQSDIEGELDFMIHCHEQGIPVPKIYLSRAGNRYEKTPSGKYYAIMDFVPGELPANATPGMIKQIAEAMARMNVLAETYRYPAPRSWPGTVIEVAKERLERLPTTPAVAEYMGFIKPIQAAFEKALETVDLSELPSGPIHGDIMWENVKFESETLQGIFDFDDCRNSYFLEDISKSFTVEFDDTKHCFFGIHGQNVQIFLDAYDAIRPLTERERQLLPLFMTASYLSRLARYLSKTVDGKLVYLDRVAGYREQYEQNPSFFLPAE